MPWRSSCCARYATRTTSRERAPPAANHGDSNATAALAGTLVGTRVDFNESPGRLVAPLELVDVILELADDLYTDCSMSEWDDYKPNGEDAWRRRFCRQPRRHPRVSFPRIAYAQ